MRVTEKEYQKIVKKAEKANLNISQYVSLSALGRDIVIIEELKEMIHHLAKIGNNLNQLTVLAHQNRIKVADLTSIKSLLEEIWRLLNLVTEHNKRN